VKQAFRADHAAGRYAEVARRVVEPTAAEAEANPRASSAKLRWAIAPATFPKPTATSTP
jgi:16S rRNA (cytosine1402-N4)-methyltransferase